MAGSAGGDGVGRLRGGRQGGAWCGGGAEGWAGWRGGQPPAGAGRGGRGEGGGTVSGVGAAEDWEGRAGIRIRETHARRDLFQRIWRLRIRVSLIPSKVTYSTEVARMVSGTYSSSRGDSGAVVCR